MTTKAFDKIAAGLREATAMARGERSATAEGNMINKRGSRGGVYDPTLSVRTPMEVRRALEAYAASHDITLSKASSAILEDWLRTHGWLVGSGQKPTGPFTDAVDAMDQATSRDAQKPRRKD